MYQLVLIVIASPMIALTVCFCIYEKNFKQINYDSVSLMFGIAIFMLLVFKIAWILYPYAADLNNKRVNNNFDAYRDLG